MFSDLTFMQWVLGVVLILGVLSYIRERRRERIRLRCLEIASTQRDRGETLHSGNMINKADAYEEYVLQGKKKPKVPS